MAIGEVVKRHLAKPSSTSLTEIAAAHSEVRALAPSASTVSCLLDIAQYFYISGQTILGIEASSNAVAATRILDDSSLLRRALTFHAALLADAANIPGAIELCAEALDLSVRHNDRVGEGATWNNLACAFLYSAQYSDAVSCLLRVLELSEIEPQLAEVRQRAFANLALCALHTENFEQGIKWAAESVAASDPLSSADELLARVTAEAHYSRLLLELNDLPGAKEHSSLAKQFALQACSQRAELVASIAEGMFEVYAGSIEGGLSRLQRALDLSRVLKASLREALTALVKAYDLCGKPQLSLVHLRELLLWTRKSVQDSSLLHHRLHLKELGFDPRVPLSASRGSVERPTIDRGKVLAELALLHRQAIAAELIEDPSGIHVFRVAKLASLLAAELGRDAETCFLLEVSARLHDIGKIGIPHSILAKTSSISADQRSLIRAHTNIGAELLAQSGLPNIDMAVDIARHHHETWDGLGYPDGIAGLAIPEAARIVALADVFDVLSHQRPYKKAWSVRDALDELRRLRGTRFDPEITEVFISMVERLSRDIIDLDSFLAQEAKDFPFIQARQKISAALAASAIESNGRSGGNRQSSLLGTRGLTT